MQTLSLSPWLMWTCSMVRDINDTKLYIELLTYSASRNALASYSAIKSGMVGAHTTDSDVVEQTSAYECGSRVTTSTRWCVSSCSSTGSHCRSWYSLRGSSPKYATTSPSTGSPGRNPAGLGTRLPSR